MTFLVPTSLKLANTWQQCTALIPNSTQIGQWTWAVRIGNNLRH